MNYLSSMSLVAGGLQFLVAAYALRLNRLFGTSRVGWSLFCAFSLLALLHLIQSVTPVVDIGMQSGVKIEVMYALISLLLLTGMVHMESLLKERTRVAELEQQMREKLESEVQKKTAHLMRAIEELQSEIDMRKSMECKVEESNTQLLYASQKVQAAESVNGLYRNMVNLLKSVNASASLVSDTMKQSKIANVVRIGNLIREHSADLGRFMSQDPRGQKLPQYIAQLAEHLENEQTMLAKELGDIKKSIEDIMALEPKQSQTFTQTAFVANSETAAEESVPSGFIAF